ASTGRKKICALALVDIVRLLSFNLPNDGFAYLLKNGLERRIDSPVARVVSRHRRHAGWIRGNAIAHFDHRVASSLNRGPDLRAYPGEDGRTIGRAFLGFHAFHFASVDIGLDLAP